MPPLSRPVREARRLLATENVREPAVPVKQIAEKHAHVLEKPLPEDISGMLVPLSPPVGNKAWAIVVNRANAALRKRFTIAHELGHLLLHNFRAPHADANSAFKVRYRDSLSSDGSVLEEIEANRFAAELLMPEKLLVPRLRDIGFDYASEEQEAQEKMGRLAKSFGVSQQALHIRLANLRNEIF
jgi:hypothetical protein